jgi:hypothetical protein
MQTMRDHIVARIERLAPGTAFSAKDFLEIASRTTRKRQVIFTSHNANLVVNGDADLIICCDHRTTGTESGGQIKFTGVINVPEINREIAEVMEGGVEAFKLRYHKYGFWFLYSPCCAALVDLFYIRAKLLQECRFEIRGPA